MIRNDPKDRGRSLQAGRDRQRAHRETSIHRDTIGYTEMRANTLDTETQKGKSRHNTDYTDRQISIKTDTERNGQAQLHKQRTADTKRQT